MSKVVVIHQPDFMPWLGFFHRLLGADLYIALDHVQFVTGTSRSWTHRDRIKTRSGPRWLSVSVQKAPLGTAIKDVLLSEEPVWRDANLNLIRENYRRAPFFDEIFPRLEALYGANHRRLVDMTLASIDMLGGMLGVEVPRMLSSELAPVGAKNEMLVDLLKKVGATQYLSGTGARAYFDPAPFDSAGIEVLWHDFTHPRYAQLFDDFVPELSAIDLLLNCGERESADILRSC